MDIYLVTKGPRGSFRTYVGSLELDGVQYLEDMLNVGFKFEMFATVPEDTAAGREIELHPMPFIDAEEHQKTIDKYKEEVSRVIGPQGYIRPADPGDYLVTNHDCYICTALATHNSGAYPCHACHSYHSPRPCSNDTRAIVTVEKDGSFRSNKPRLMETNNDMDSGQGDSSL